jgi:hypothetical protein
MGVVHFASYQHWAVQWKPLLRLLMTAFGSGVKTLALLLFMTVTFEQNFHDDKEF